MRLQSKSFPHGNKKTKHWDYLQQTYFSFTNCQRPEKQDYGAKKTPWTGPIQFFADQNSMLNSGRGHQKKFIETSRRGKNGTSEVDDYPERRWINKEIHCSFEEDEALKQ